MALSSPSPTVPEEGKRSVESTLDSVIGMNDSAGCWCARPNSHIKGIDDEG